MNGASFASGAVAPGQMFTIFGSNLGPSSLTYHDDLSWDQRFIGAINGTEVLFDGVPAPMIYTSSGQVAGVVPYEVAGKTSTAVQVLYEGVASDSAAINTGGNHNSASDPEVRGNTLVMFATGEGQTTPTGIDGALAIGATLPMPKLPVTVKIVDIDATVSYAGAAPGEIAGVMQINVVIPDNAPTGAAVPVLLRVGAAQSPTNTTIAIK